MSIPGGKQIIAVSDMNQMEFPFKCKAYKKDLGNNFNRLLQVSKVGGQVWRVPIPRSA